MNFTQEVKNYASAIHRLTCRTNHIDGCGWFYGEEHRQFDYEATQKMLPQLKTIATVEQLHNLADLLCHNEDWK